MTWRYGRPFSWDWEFESGFLQRRVCKMQPNAWTSLLMAGAAGMLYTPPSQAAEGTLETTTVRIGKLETT